MKNKQAFTLIELLVVVLIIGILAAVAVPKYQKAVQKARATQLVTLSKAIVDAQQAYYLANGIYAERADELAIEYPISNDGTEFRTNQWSCSFVYANGIGGRPRTSCRWDDLGILLQWEHQTANMNCCPISPYERGEWLCQDLTKKKTPYDTTTHCYSGKR